MPNRILKESIRTSETINQLRPEEEVFFYRLLTACDDYGRFDGRIEIIRATCFPLRLDHVSNEDVRKWLNKLIKVGLVALYSVDNRPYLQIVTWERHQQIRAKRSKYPAPETACEQVLANDIMFNQSLTSAGTCPRESESESKSESEREINTSSSDDESADADGARGSDVPADSDSDKTLKDPARFVMDEYNRIFAGCWKRPLQLTPDRRAKIQARLKRFTVQDLVAAMINIRASPFHCGENDRGQVYATPEFIFRNDAQVDKWRNMEVQTNGRSSTVSECTRKHGKYDDLVLR